MAETKLTEAEFLAQQADEARAALSRAMNDLKLKIGQGVDPRLWLQDYPWMTMGAAAAAGFVAATAVVPSKEQQALKKLAEIERALHEPKDRAAQTNGKENHKANGSLASVVLREVFGLLKPIISSVLAGVLQAQTTGAAAPDPAPSVDPVAGS